MITTLADHLTSRSSQLLRYLILFHTILFTLSMTSSETAKPKVLCLGLAAVDFVAMVDHFPEPDEKMRSSRLTIEGGGNAANTACAMGRLSNWINVDFMTGVGEDSNGNIIVESLEKNQVHVRAERYPGSSPFSYILSTDIDGEDTRTIIHQPASGDVTVEFIQSSALNDVAAVHFDCRYPKAAVALAKRCVDMGIPYSVDVERPREGLLELLKDASVVICNSNYCNTVLGRPAVANKDDLNYQGPADRLRTVMREQAPKAKIAVVTLGSRGSCLIRMAQADPQESEIRQRSATSTGETTSQKNFLSDSSENAVPDAFLQNGVLCCQAFPNVNVVDTTGAGDAFIGGFLTALWASAQWGKTSSGQASVSTPTDVQVLSRALRIASRVSSQKIQQPGSRAGLPYGDDDFIASEMKVLHSRLAVAAAL